jgi:hypothetical protein
MHLPIDSAQVRVSQSLQLSRNNRLETKRARGNQIKPWHKSGIPGGHEHFPGRVASVISSTQ